MTSTIQRKRPGPRRPTDIIKRSIKVDGKATSVSLETPFWDAAKEIAQSRGLTVSDLITSIAQNREPGGNVSSAIRVFVVDHYRSRSSETNAER